MDTYCKECSVSFDFEQRDKKQKSIAPEKFSI
jgi:hypothetical protein